MQVSLSGPLRAAADDEASIEIEASNIRELFAKLVERFPDMAEELDRGVAVSIDGVIYRDDWTTPIPKNAAVFLMPRIEGG